MELTYFQIFPFLTTFGNVPLTIPSIILCGFWMSSMFLMKSDFNLSAKMGWKAVMEVYSEEALPRLY